MSLKIKNAVRERDEQKCVDCGMTRTEHLDKYKRDIQVHRNVPGSEYSVDGCVTVCVKCHGRRHRLPKNVDKPRPPSRDKTNYLAVPKEWYELLEEYAKERSDADTTHSVAWAGRVAIRKFLVEIGKFPKP